MPRVLHVRATRTSLPVRTGQLAPGGALLHDAISFGRVVRMHTIALQVAFVVLRHPVDLLLSEARLLGLARV